MISVRDAQSVLRPTLLAGALLVAMSGEIASADIYNFTFTADPIASAAWSATYPLASMSLQFTTDSSNVIIGISGNVTGGVGAGFGAITGIIAPNGFLGNDNQLNPTPAPDTSGNLPYLSGAGVSFTVGTDSLNLWYQTAQSGQPSTFNLLDENYENGGSTPGINTYGTLNITAATAPAPRPGQGLATLVAVAVAGAGVRILRRRGASA